MTQPFIRRELLHIHGNFSIYSYGLAIACGVLLFIFLMQRHPRFHALKLKNHFIGILIIGVVAGIVGGRGLYLLTEITDISPSSICAYWEGGFSLLGSLMSILICLPLYLWYRGIPIIPFLDLAAIHAPLLQSIARVGCFFAGCCHGTPTSAAWGFTYCDPHSAAPCGVALHPTQLYSAILLMLSFAFLYFFAQHRYKKPGQLTCIYLMLMSSERFVVDFWRDDRGLHTAFQGVTFSIHQSIAAVLFVIAGVCLCVASWRREPTHERI